MIATISKSQKFPNRRNDDGELTPHPGLLIFLFVVLRQAILFFLLLLADLIVISPTHIADAVPDNKFLYKTIGYDFSLLWAWVGAFLRVTYFYG